MDYSPTLGIIGSGVMAAGICQITVCKGASCTVFGRKAAKLENLRATVARGGKMSVRRKIADADEFASGLEKLSTTQDVSGLAGCDIIIEAISEDYAAKVEVLRNVAEICPEAVICSNTSSFSITKLAEDSGLGARFLGLHFMNPVPVSKMVELVTHAGMSWEAAEKARELAKFLGLEAVEVKDSPGFVVNRLLIPLIAEAARLLEEKTCSALEIDTAMRLACGHPMGPLALGDMIGLDIVLAELEQFEHELGPRFTPPESVKKLVVDGKLGRKSGEGFYRY